MYIYIYIRTVSLVVIAPLSNSHRASARHRIEAITKHCTPLLTQGQYLDLCDTQDIFRCATQQTFVSTHKPQELYKNLNDKRATWSASLAHLSLQPSWLKTADAIGTR